MKNYKNCQSYGMPMNKDPKNGGTNSDGTKNLMYCSYCYENGAFTQPDITVDEMKALVKGKMKEMGFPGFLAGFFTKGIPKLERWEMN
jgi:hypothetical protein